MIRRELPGGARALFTSREQGNLSTLRGELPEQGVARRSQLCGELGLSWLCAGPQVHGAEVQAVRDDAAAARAGAGAGEPSSEPADGRATALRGVGMMVLSADCVPVVVACDGAVAALHAGWRGLAAGVLEQGVATLRELARPGGERTGAGEQQLEIHALIGPCAGVCCYEVGPEVHDAFCGAHRVGRNLDLQALAAERLLEAGAARVARVGVCTICDERYFSHRREGAGAGRQAGIAWLP